VPVYTRVLLNTFLTSLVVTGLCLALGRTYAWLVILGSKGPIVAAYGALGLGPVPQWA
jgi:ABC-type spermidine/putrescine transport system permease subunit I